MVSGYDNELYNDFLQGWYKVKKNTRAERGIKRTEVLWMNYQTSQITLLSYVKEEGEIKW